MLFVLSLHVMDDGKVVFVGCVVGFVSCFFVTKKKKKGKTGKKCVKNKDKRKTKVILAKSEAKSVLINMLMLRNQL